jgi:hypothetical protein
MGADTSALVAWSLRVPRRLTSVYGSANLTARRKMRAIVRQGFGF